MRRASKLNECDNPLEFVGDRPVSPTGRQFAYEGSTTTGRRVSQRTVNAARSAVGRKRNPGVIRRALTRVGLMRATPAGGQQLKRTAPGRQLTGAQVRARTAARRALANRGTTAGKRRTRTILAKARRQGAAR